MTEQAPAPAPIAPQSSEAPPPSNEPSWWIDDNTPGQGERPVWLPPKYNKVSDLGNGYMQAEKRLGGFTGAPEEYNLSDLELDESQFLLQELKAVGKELNMSEDGLKKFLGRMNTAMETENEAHMSDEIKKLGPDGERQLKQYENWTKNYFKPEKAEVVKGMIRTAEQLTVFNEIMANTHMSAVPTSHSMAMANPHETVAELRKEMKENITKYENDKTYNTNFSKRLQQAVARENR